MDMNELGATEQSTEAQTIVEAHQSPKTNEEQRPVPFALTNAVVIGVMLAMLAVTACTRQGVAAASARATTSTATSPAEKRGTSFRVTTLLDRMTDHKGVAARSVGEDGLMNLTWYCYEGEPLSVHLMWNRYLIGYGTNHPFIHVYYRFPPGGMKFPAEHWEMDPNHQGAMLGGSAALTFTAQALKADSVLVEVVDRDLDKVIDSIKLDGLAAAFTQFSCAASMRSALETKVDATKVDGTKVQRQPLQWNSATKTIETVDGQPWDGTDVKPPKPAPQDMTN